MKEQNDSKTIMFMIVAIIIFAINLVGIIYGVQVDKKIETKKESLAAVTSEDNTDNLTQKIRVLQSSVTVCGMTLFGLIAKTLFGMILMVFLFLPEQVYDYLKWDMFEYLFWGGRFERIVKIILIAMTLWNIISPILDMKDWIVLKNEMESLLDDMFNILSDESWFSLQ